MIKIDDPDDSDHQLKLRGEGHLRLFDVLPKIPNHHLHPHFLLKIQESSQNQTIHLKFDFTNMLLSKNNHYHYDAATWTESAASLESPPARSSAAPSSAPRETSKHPRSSSSLLNVNVNVFPAQCQSSAPMPRTSAKWDQC